MTNINKTKTIEETFKMKMISNIIKLNPQMDKMPVETNSKVLTKMRWSISRNPSQTLKTISKNIIKNKLNLQNSRIKTFIQKKIISKSWYMTQNLRIKNRTNKLLIKSTKARSKKMNMRNHQHQSTSKTKWWKKISKNIRLEQRTHQPTQTLHSKKSWCCPPFKSQRFKIQISTSKQKIKWIETIIMLKAMAHLAKLK